MAFSVKKVIFFTKQFSAAVEHKKNPSQTIFQARKKSWSHQRLFVACLKGFFDREAFNVQNLFFNNKKCAFCREKKVSKKCPSKKKNKGKFGQKVASHSLTQLERSSRLQPFLLKSGLWWRSMFIVKAVIMSREDRDDTVLRSLLIFFQYFFSMIYSKLGF